MGARIKLTCATNTASESVTFRMARPPFLIVADNPSDATWTGQVTVQQSMQTPPLPNNGGGVTNDGTTDANVTDWQVVGTINPGAMINWSNPLYRVRINGSSVSGGGTGVTGGTCKVYFLEQAFNPDSASDK